MGPGEVRLVAISGWGCPVPDFHLDTCDPDLAGESADLSGCFVLALPRAPSNQDPPPYWAGPHRMQGTFLQRRMTLPQWYAKIGRPAPEGACEETTYRVFEYISWCIELSEADYWKYYEDRSDVMGDGEKAAYEADIERLRAHQCANTK